MARTSIFETKYSALSAQEITCLTTDGNLNAGLPATALAASLQVVAIVIEAISLSVGALGFPPGSIAK